MKNIDQKTLQSDEYKAHVDRVQKEINQNFKYLGTMRRPDRFETGDIAYYLTGAKVGRVISEQNDKITVDFGDHTETVSRLESIKINHKHQLLELMEIDVDVSPKLF